MIKTMMEVGGVCMQSIYIIFIRASDHALFQNFAICDMWQSRVEIEHYSVAYSSALPHLKHNFSLRGGAHTCYVNVSSIHEPVKEVLRYSTLNTVMCS